MKRLRSCRRDGGRPSRKAGDASDPASCFASRGFLLALAVSGALTTSSLSARATESSLELAWSAPAECPDGRAVKGEVLRVAGGGSKAPRHFKARVKVEAAAASSGRKLTLFHRARSGLRRANSFGNLLRLTCRRRGTDTCADLEPRCSRPRRAANQAGDGATRFARHRARTSVQVSAPPSVLELYLSNRELEGGQRDSLEKTGEPVAQADRSLRTTA